MSHVFYNALQHTITATHFYLPLQVSVGVDFLVVTELQNANYILGNPTYVHLNKTKSDGTFLFQNRKKIILSELFHYNFFRTNYAVMENLLT